MPARVVDRFGEHSCWSGPAFAAVCRLLNTLMVTLELVAGVHAPLSTVQRNTFVPWPKLFTCDVGLFGLTTVPLPLTKAHEPTAGEIALFAAKVVLFVGRHRSCAGPALAMG